MKQMPELGLNKIVPYIMLFLILMQTAHNALDSKFSSISIQSSNAEVWGSESFNSKKTRHAAAEKGCTNSIGLQAADQ